MQTPSNNADGKKMEGVQDAPASKRRKLNNEDAPDMSLRTLIPPKDCPRLQTLLRRGDVEMLDGAAIIGASKGEKGGKTSSSEGASLHYDWSVVISRAKSHPHEAREPYFGAMVDSADTPRCETDAAKNTILAYKPLHAMLKYDPPLEAVEAVLRAHPEAALDVTFEGTALRIASESRVSSMLVLRLLLVAEMALRRRMAQQSEAEKKVRWDESSLKDSGEKNEGDVQVSTEMFSGYNPIIWITERRIPVHTVAMLLKWYPIGAFQRPYDDDGAPVDGMAASAGMLDMDGAGTESPLIEMVDDFSREIYDEADDEVRDTQQDDEGDGDSDGRDTKEDGASSGSEDGKGAEGAVEDAMRSKMIKQRQHMRREQRWEKFLHILFATDMALESIRPPAPAMEGNGCASAAASAPTATSKTAASVTATSATPSGASASASATAAAASSNNNCPEATPKAQPPNPFRPVHAWIRCLTTPALCLEHCRPYGVWSVLRVMGQRIPSEFTGRDLNDGNRTAFQILAESQASDCRLCQDEVKDIVECLIDADHRSAFQPRNSDGRLIGHVALENGWPCKDLFARKKSATCA